MDKKLTFKYMILYNALNIGYTRAFFGFHKDLKKEHKY